MATDFELDDDGATEVVHGSPRRKAMQPIVTEEIVRAPAGGRMKAMMQAGAAGRRDFIQFRKANQPAVRITLPHVGVFKAIWAVWSANRVAGAADPGVSVSDIKAHFKACGRTVTEASIHLAVRSLTKGGGLRSTDQHTGFQARRVRYYPTEHGVQAFAMAEVLGDGSFVQVGGATAAWRNRSDSEPGSVFDYATLIRGGSYLDPAEIA